MEENKKSDSEKAVLEKLLDINEEIAVIMACDMLFAGVDTVRRLLMITVLDKILLYLLTNHEIY